MRGKVLVAEEGMRVDQKDGAHWCRGDGIALEGKNACTF